MNKMLDILKGARWFEVLLALIAIAILLLQFAGSVSFGGGGTELERRLSGILGQIDGVGRVKVMVTQSAGGVPEGALVVAEGADDVGVCLRLQYAVQTLLGIEASKIEIVRYAQ